MHQRTSWRCEDREETKVYNPKGPGSRCVSTSALDPYSPPSSREKEGESVQSEEVIE